MDQKAPLTALAEGRKYVIKKEWDTPDTVSYTYEFPGNFTVTFMNTYVSSVSDGAIEFRGTKGTLKIDRRYLAVYPEGVKWVPGTSLPEPEILMRSEHDGTRDHLQNFLDCMRSRKSPNAPVGAAHEAARTCHLGNIALRRGQKVTWDSKREKVVL
jgi:predicted dehydrogenase